MGHFPREDSQASTSRVRQRVGPRRSATSLETSVKRTGDEGNYSRKRDPWPWCGPLPPLLPMLAMNMADRKGPGEPGHLVAGLLLELRALPRAALRAARGSVAEGAVEPSDPVSQALMDTSMQPGPREDLSPQTCLSSGLFCVKTIPVFECA